MGSENTHSNTHFFPCCIYLMSRQLRWGKTTFPSLQCVSHILSVHLCLWMWHTYRAVTYHWGELNVFFLSCQPLNLIYSDYHVTFDIRVTGLFKDGRTLFLPQRKRNEQVLRGKKQVRNICTLKHLSFALSTLWPFRMKEKVQIQF